MPFRSALKSFKPIGFCEFKNTKFSSENIHELKKEMDKNIEKFNNIPYPLPNFPTLCIKDIQMILDVPRKKPGSGPVIQHVPRRWTDSYGDLAISQMGSFHSFNLPLNYGDRNEVVCPEEEPTLEKLQKALLSLILTYPWVRIEIHQLFFFSNHQIDDKATQDFYHKLLKSLSTNSSLRSLTISPFSLSKYRDNLILFLFKKNLQYLHLEITEADTPSWEALFRALEYPFRVRSFNLGDSALDSSVYIALAELLDKNYLIKIKLSEPTDAALLDAFQLLKKQLSKSGLERFQEKHLTQDNLFQIAIQSLEKLKSFEFSGYQLSQKAKYEKQFSFLLKDPAYLGTEENYYDVLNSIFQKHFYLIDKKCASLIQLNLNTYPKNSTQTIGSILLEKALEANNQNAIQTLLNTNANVLEFPQHENEPFLVKVLQSSGAVKELVLNHIRQKHLLEESDLLQLSIADDSKTIGYVLLGKALKTQNPLMLKDLLKINVNLFERPKDNEEPFLVKVLQSKGTLKRMVVEYIQKDSQMMNLATEYFGSDSNLKNVFEKIKDHLDHYGAHLVKKDNPSLLVSIANSILMTWREIINLENPSDKRGQEYAKMYLNLNESLKVFEQALPSYDTFDEIHKIIINMKEISTGAIRGLFNSSLLHKKSLKLITEFEHELLSTKKLVFDKSIHQIKKAREHDRLAFNEKIEKLEEKNAEMRKRQVLMEAENNQTKAENAEMRKKQVQMEAQISTLMAQMGAHTFFSEEKPHSSNLTNQTDGEHEEPFLANQQNLY